MGYLILPELISRMKPVSQAIVQSMMQKALNQGMKSILMFLMIITEAVYRTAIAIAIFFQRQQSAIKKMTPRPYKP